MRKYLVSAFVVVGLCGNCQAVENIKIQPMSRYDGISKEELAKKRREKIIYSSFYRYDYEPKVFDDVKGGEKWVGDKASCSYYKFNDGVSEASIWINNPDILVHMSGARKYFTGVYVGEYNPVFCTYAKQLLFKPLKMTIDKEKKEITSVYKAHNILLGIGSHVFGAIDFILSPVNAYDAGFNYYALAENSGITFDIEKNKRNSVEALTDIVSTRSRMEVCQQCYVHETESCMCYNNITNTAAQLTSKQAEMLFKFWKEKPKSKDAEADFYYRIKFVK